LHIKAVQASCEVLVMTQQPHLQEIKYHTPHNLWICFLKHTGIKCEPLISTKFVSTFVHRLTCCNLAISDFWRTGELPWACVRVRPHWWKEWSQLLNQITDILFIRNSGRWTSLSNSSRVWLSFVMSVSALEEFSISYCILPYVEALLHQKPVAVFTDRVLDFQSCESVEVLQSLPCRHIRIKWIR
jgi:hypothetical protein